MPNIKSAFKRLRQDKKRHVRNLKIKSELRYLSKKFALALHAKNAEEIKKLGTMLVSKLNRAGSKGVIHKNNASRTVSRILSKLAKIG